MRVVNFSNFVKIVIVTHSIASVMNWKFELLKIWELAL